LSVDAGNAGKARRASTSKGRAKGVTPETTDGAWTVLEVLFPRPAKADAVSHPVAPSGPSSIFRESPARRVSASMNTVRPQGYCGPAMRPR
jgi:hypothetical protein